MESALLVDIDGATKPELPRGLAREGVRVHATTQGSVARFSRFVSSADPLGIPDPSPLLDGHQFFGATEDDYVPIDRFVDDLIEVIERREPDVVLPYKEEHVIVMAHEHDRIESETGARFALPDPQDVLDATLKHRTFQRAEEAGLTIPNTYYPDTPEAVREVFEAEAGRVVAKPSLARSAGGLAICETPEEGVEAFESISEHSRPIFQEHVSGRDYVACVVADRDHRSVGRFTAEEVVLTKGDVGGSLCSISCRQDAVDRQLEQIPEAFDWIGPASPEYIVDEETGEAKLMEINPRMFGHTTIAIRSGVNVPYLYDRVIRGESVEPVVDYELDLMWWDPYRLFRTGQLGQVLNRVPGRTLRGKAYQCRYPISDPVFGGLMIASDVKRALLD